MENREPVLQDLVDRVAVELEGESVLVGHHPGPERVPGEHREPADPRPRAHPADARPTAWVASAPWTTKCTEPTGSPSR